MGSETEIKMSELTNTNSANAEDILMIVQNGVNKKISISSLFNSILLERDKRKYHVGKLVFETSNTNPATYLGFGTWELWGSGRVPVGVDLNDIDFDEVEKTGGSKDYQKHTHVLSSMNFPLVNSHSDYSGSTGWGVTSDYNTKNGGEILGKTTKESGTGDSGNLQPYITCYIWKRIA